MGAFKQLKDRCLYVDMTEIHVPSWKIREVQKAALEKHRLLKKIDPFARCMGKPLKFKTPQQLRDACDSYFKAQECYIFDKYGQPFKDPMTGELIIGTKPLTLSGLALHIGVETGILRRYQTIAKSGTIPMEYYEVITEALQKIENYAERRSYERDAQRGAQFILQSAFKWNTGKETSDIKSAKTKDKIAMERLKMEKEEHALKMELLRAGLGNEVDNDINITITRAKKQNEQ